MTGAVNILPQQQSINFALNHSTTLIWNFNRRFQRSPSFSTLSSLTKLCHLTLLPSLAQPLITQSLCPRPTPNIPSTRSHLLRRYRPTMTITTITTITTTTIIIPTLTTATLILILRMVIPATTSTRLTITQQLRRSLTSHLEVTFLRPAFQVPPFESPFIDGLKQGLISSLYDKKPSFIAIISSKP